ncbi:OmpA family protein [Gymnodinialimonas ceratoperidinii]|uniref:OmpA family protein n=1 Tax=Gymnodinialimonas ceratoperidinii TaxID=2856823 RepID=A0A8F6YAB0_9RHOB|nr:OmpA family protein [Gymnodinialimonas ceratoperidinii]QXT39774.1 OmpA family protein [Gymnodinialimonas ceratoperidinii]
MATREDDQSGTNEAEQNSTEPRKLITPPLLMLTAVVLTLSAVVGGLLVTRQPSAPLPIVEFTPRLGLTPDVEIRDDRDGHSAASIDAEALPGELQHERAEAPLAVGEVILTSLSLEDTAAHGSRDADAMEAATETCREALQDVAERLAIRFPAGSTAAAPGDLEAARAFAQHATSCDGIRIMVRGHSDATGDETHNLTLSWERAESVIAALGAAGLDTSRFDPIGFGSRRLSPGAPTERADALSRRVEFAVLPQYH